jgi:hypothetical protein
MKRMCSLTAAWRASVVRGYLAYGAMPNPARIREGSRAGLGAIYGGMAEDLTSR